MENVNGVAASDMAAVTGFLVTAWMPRRGCSTMYNVGCFSRLYLLLNQTSCGSPNTVSRRRSCIPFAVAAVVSEGEVEDLDRAPGRVLLLSQAPEHQLETLACAPSTVAVTSNRKKKKVSTREN